MIVEPKVKSFICLTAHPEGCKQNVKEQIDYVKNQTKTEGPKKVLIIGSSTGYGLASRISAAYSCGASTIGIMFEKEATQVRTATAGWYNTAAFEEFAIKDGYYAKTINGDAFSNEVKQKTIELIKNDLGKIDMVIYSLAAPKRTDKDGIVYSSVLKTIGEDFTNKTLNLKDNTVIDVTIKAAIDEEIKSTVKVMGGEDWKDWIDALYKADVLEDNAITVAYSYIGPKVTYPIYWDGTIGEAKKHLFNTSKQINEEYKSIKAYISVNKALVTQASAAIPIVPLYIAILYKLMKQKGTHEGCIEQIYRLFNSKLFVNKPVIDNKGMIRLDDYELADDIQKDVVQIWNKIDNTNVNQLADIQGYWEDFYHMCGFNFKDVDYSKDVDINIKVKSLSN